MKILLFHNLIAWKDYIINNNFYYFFHYIKLTYKDFINFYFFFDKGSVKLHLLKKKFLIFLPKLNKDFFFLIKEKTLVGIFNRNFFDKFEDEFVKKIKDKYIIDSKYRELGLKLFNRVFSKKEKIYIKYYSTINVLALYRIFIDALRIRKRKK